MYACVRVVGDTGIHWVIVMSQSKPHINTETYVYVFTKNKLDALLRKHYIMWPHDHVEIERRQEYHWKVKSHHITV